MQNIPEILKILGKLAAILSIAVSSHTSVPQTVLQPLSDTLQIIEINLNKPLGGVIDAPQLTIAEQLEGKTSEQKSLIKDKEISKLNLLGTYTDNKTGITVEITKSPKQIIADGKDGIELFAKAWKNGQQLGFGKDGSVEIERFRFYNPPILVNDDLGNIKKYSWTPSLKATTTYSYREDPAAAVKKALADTIQVASKDEKNIIAGKIGNTTTTCYPDAGSGGGNTSVDGQTKQNYAAGSGVIWDTMVNAAGNTFDDTATTIYVVGNQSDNVNNKFVINWRGIFNFDCSAIPDTDNIDSATVSLYGDTEKVASRDQLNINIYSSNSASNNSLTGTDYSTLGTTEFSTSITYANWTIGAYNNFALNSSGIAAVSKTGITKLGTRNPSKDVANVSPTWNSETSDDYRSMSADTAGTTQDPKLVVVSSAAATAKSNVQMILYEE